MSSDPISRAERAAGAGAPGPKRRSWARRLGFALYVLLAGILLVEIALRILTYDDEGHAALFGLKLVPFAAVPQGHAEKLALTPDQCPYVMPDPDLGWVIKPNGRHPEAPFAANSLGLRSAPAEVERTKPAGTTRVLLIGDSFTHGDEIPWPETWSAKLQAELGEAYQVLNAGVPGYGCDQALLRYTLRLRDALAPDVVVLSLCRDDLPRNVNLFRALYHHWTDFPWSKPRFVLEGDGLRLVNHPVVPPEQVEETLRRFDSSPLRPFDSCYDQGLHRDDWRYVSRLFRYYRSREVHRERYDRLIRLIRKGGEGVLVTARIAKKFEDEARHGGARPLVVFLPQHDDLPSYKPGGHPPLRFLREEMERLGVRPLDLGPAFFAGIGPGEGPEVLYVNGRGHPNGRATAIIAAELARVLRR